MDIFHIVISFHHFITIDIWQKMVNKLNFKLMIQSKLQKNTNFMSDVRIKINVCGMIGLFYMLLKLVKYNSALTVLRKIFPVH